jgi:hypothetical protein
MVEAKKKELAVAKYLEIHSWQNKKSYIFVLV